MSRQWKAKLIGKGSKRAYLETDLVGLQVPEERSRVVNGARKAGWVGLFI